MAAKFKFNAFQLISVSTGIIYLWFGFLKFFHGMSPAEDLAKNTISALTFNTIPPAISIILLALWETAVGMMLLLNIYKKAAIRIALVHLAFTFTPLFLFPELCFQKPPFVFTLVGQYIVKNLILVAALIVLLKNTKKGG